MKNLYYPETYIPAIKRQLPFFIFLLIAMASQSQTKYYVKPGAAGSGASWALAGDLQTVINAAAVGSQVWVAAGTYYPNNWATGSVGSPTLTTRDYAIALKNGVSIYGGFVGTETLLTQRNPATNVTILSGDIGTVGTYTDDCYHIIVSVSNDNSALLDGFTIKYGYASGASTITYGGQTLNQNFGGAVFLYNSYPVIQHCIISNNFAASGGAIYNRNSGGTPPVFGSCTFSSNIANSAADGGGAAYNYSSTVITFDTCTFSSNKATGQDGGAAYGNSSSVFIFNDCTISSNTAAANGGGIYVNNSSVLTISNSTLSSNVAAGSGGAIVTMSSSATNVSNTSFTSNTANSATLGGGAIYSYSTGGSSATNCTFTSNSAVEYGGGFYGNSGSGGLIMQHCVFASNSAVYGAGMANTGGSAPTVNNCKFSNGSATYGGAVYNNTGSAIFGVDSFFNNTSTATSGMGGGGVVNDAANCTYSHCWFHGNVTNGADGAGQYDNSSAAPVDSSCVFEANIAGGAASNGGGMYRNTGNGKVYNSVFVDNSCKTNGGGYYNNASNSTVENCTFYNNTAVTGAGIYDPLGDNAKYYSNMIWGNHPDGLGLGGGSNAGVKIQFNNLQAALTPVNSIKNNTSGAPTFYNTGSYVGSDGKWATGDDGLHLATTSAFGLDAVVMATIGAGNYMTDDIVVAPRPDVVGETAVDMGAYEGPGLASLPMLLLNFTAAPVASNTVALKWQVDAATQAAVYEVQKSGNGPGFFTIGTLDAVSAESVYNYTDAHAGDETLYYRLKLTADDGSVTYSPVAIVRRTSYAAGQLALRPSITSGDNITLFAGAVPGDTHLSIRVTDASGRTQLLTAVAVGQGDNTIPINISRLGKGLYFLQVAETSGFQKILTFEKL